MTGKSTKSSDIDNAVRTLAIVFVFFVTWSVLTHLARYNHVWWNTVVVFTLAWVVADIIDELSEQRIRGDFEVKVRIKSHPFVFKIPRLAFAFAIYFGVIVIATLGGGFVTDGILTAFNFIFGKAEASEDYISMVSFLAGFLVLGDLYYRNRESNHKNDNS